MNFFNLLPSETIEFIFKKLNLNDLINLRIVDKRFKQICEQIKIKQLYVSDKLHHSSLFWFYTNEPTYLNKENSIGFSKFKNYATIFQLDKYLKRLILHINDFDFSILNKFKLLEQLNIKTNQLIDNYKLSLDHLKTVDIFMYYNWDYELTFDTIKLFAFSFLNEDPKDNIIFKYPDKIRFLEIDNHDDYLEKFINLEHLKLYGLYDETTCTDILSQFKNLKILNLIILEFRYDEYDITMNDIKFLIDEKENLRKTELEIYLNGVKLIDQNKFNELIWSSNLDEFNYNLFEFQIKNYDLLNDNCERCEINYCDLIKLIKIIPSSFTNKFPFINQVKANDHIDNEDQFIEFLQSLKCLTELRLIDCELSKSFYDQLINLVYLNDLKTLIIEEKEDLEMNFDFILQLKQLKHFQTNQIITNHIDLIDKLFKQNEIIRGFFFKSNLKNYIKIDKWNSSLFKIRSHLLDDNFSIELKDLDDVISRLKELKF